MAAANPKRRDGLSWLFHIVHLAALAFIVAGWASPARGALLFYMVFLPALVLQWKLNNNTCILNNLENWLRHGRWRAPDRNEEEGAWFKTLVRDVTGATLTPAAANALIYAALALFWALAWWRLSHFQGA